MNRQELKELELTDEQIDSVMKTYGKSVNDIKSKADKVDVLESQVTDYKEQLTARDEQLTELKKANPEELQAEIDRLTEVNETKETEFNQKIEAQRKDAAIELALKDAKARDSNIARAALDLDVITFKDGKLIGLDEQLKDAVENKSYLFDLKDTTTPPGIKGRKPKEGDNPQTGVTRDELNSMTYKERVEFKQNNEEEYNKIIKGE